MNKKMLKYISIYGLILVISVIVAELLIFVSCKSTGGWGCLLLAWGIAYPGAIIDNVVNLNTTYSLTLFNAIFYFILGSLIGWIVWKVKKKK